jgi:hypothetical protein
MRSSGLSVSPFLGCAHSSVANLLDREIFVEVATPCGIVERLFLYKCDKSFSFDFTQMIRKHLQSSLSYFAVANQSDTSRINPMC